MTVHLYIHRGRLAWSGYNASGDPRHEPYALVVDIGREAILTSDDPPQLYLIGPGPQHFAKFTPAAFATAARVGYFGFRVVGGTEAGAIARDKRERARPSDRRRREQSA